jgi:hypothetical protein
MADNPGSGRIFFQYKSNQVFQLTFSKFINESGSGRHSCLYRFAFGKIDEVKYEYKYNYKYIDIRLTDTLCAEQSLFHRFIIALRSMFNCLATAQNSAMIDSNKGKRLLFLDEEEDIEDIRYNIMKYCNDRWNSYWEKPFILLELLGAIHKNHDSIIRNIIFLCQRGVLIAPDALNPKHFRKEPEACLGMDLRLNIKNQRAIETYLNKYESNHATFTQENVDKRPELGKEWDAFLCHASEDKESFAKPLAIELRKRRFDIWYDEFCLTVGDSLRKSIEYGLKSSRYGIVVLSHAFFQKNWPENELSALYQQENNVNNKILPIWYQISHHDVVNNEPLLADRFAIKSEEGIDAVADKIEVVLRKIKEKTE